STTMSASLRPAWGRAFGASSIFTISAGRPFVPGVAGRPVRGSALGSTGGAVVVDAGGCGCVVVLAASFFPPPEQAAPARQTPTAAATTARPRRRCGRRDREPSGDVGIAAAGYPARPEVLVTPRLRRQECTGRCDQPPPPAVVSTGRSPARRLGSPRPSPSSGGRDAERGPPRRARRGPCLWRAGGGGGGGHPHGRPGVPARRRPLDGRDGRPAGRPRPGRRPRRPTRARTADAHPRSPDRRHRRLRGPRRRGRGLRRGGTPGASGGPGRRRDRRGPRRGGPPPRRRWRSRAGPDRRGPDPTGPDHDMTEAAGDDLTRVAADILGVEVGPARAVDLARAAGAARAAGGPADGPLDDRALAARLRAARPD